MTAASSTTDDAVRRAADALAAADALWIGAGAGMGVDSGLPDFRGRHGFWRAYPPYQKLGLDFFSLANPRWFAEDPALAWGFYGHRLHLYRSAQPHDGFAVLRSWVARMKHGAFVYTSNVDGHFQAAGFDPARLLEVHGSIHFAQCTARCGVGVFPADGFVVDVDPTTMRARPPLPACPACAALARPNILLFGDYDWQSTRSDEQHARMRDWLGRAASARLVVVECGAGTAVPTVRYASEDLARNPGVVLVRINPRDADVPDGHISLRLGAAEALAAIDRAGKSA